jgi:hypothetical protein
MSAPAAKAFSEPVMTIAPIAGSASKPFQRRNMTSPITVRVQRVQRLRAVERDEADLAARLDQDGFIAMVPPAFARNEPR